VNAARRTVLPPITPRAFSCRCGRPVFFGNSECLACGTALGYDPALRALLPLDPEPARGRAGTGGGPIWRAVDARRRVQRYWRCAHLDTPAASRPSAGSCRR
jgi:hypothetical protein